MNHETKLIPYDSPEAAQRVTVDLWKSSDGRLFSDEASARFTGCTHRPCTTCGKLAEKSYTICTECRVVADDARWNTKPRKPWDGEQMVYSQFLDEYHDSPDSALESAQIEDPDATMDGLRLVLCRPRFAQIDSETFQDITPEDADLPREVLAAIEAFNKAVAGVVCCWEPSEYAMALEVAP